MVAIESIAASPITMALNALKNRYSSRMLCRIFEIHFTIRTRLRLRHSMWDGGMVRDTLRVF